MKLNKKKLIALGLSALMCVSPLSSVAFAEELSDGSEEVIELVAEEAAEEVELPAVEAESNELGYGWVDNKSYWMFVLPGDTYTGEDEVTYTVGKDEAPICLFYLYSPKENKFRSEKVTATKTVLDTKFPCQDDAGYKLTANLTVDKQPIDASRVIYAPAAHKWVEISRLIKENPTCTGKGKAYVVRECSVCGRHEEGVEVDIPALGHDLSKKDPVTHVSDAEKNLGTTGTLHYAVSYDDKARTAENQPVIIKNTKLNEDGEVVLVDDQKDGYYAVEVKQECSRCNDPDVNKSVYDIYEILAKTSYMEKVDQTSIKGIASELPVYYDSTNPVFQTENIELSNCTVAGSYDVVTYVNEQPVNRRTITVPAHHMETRVQIEFDYKNNKYITDGTAIARQFTVVYTKDGYKITNNHCTDSFVYYEVVHCTAAGCPNKESTDKYVLATVPAKTDVTVDEKTGKNLYTQHLATTANKGEVSRTPIIKTKDGDHILNKAAKEEIDAASKAKNFTYAVLKGLVDKYSDVKIGAKGYEDADHDYVIVEYYCNICGKYHEDAKYLVPHVPMIPVEDPATKIEPTCYSTGYYEAVTYCEICGHELHRRPMNIPKTKHENQKKNYTTNKVYDDIDNENGLTPKVEFIGSVVVGYNGFNAGGAGEKIETGLKVNGAANHPAVTYINKDGSVVAVGAVLNPAHVGTLTYEGWSYAEQDYAVSVRVYTNCGICNNHKLDLLNSNVTIEVVDVTEKAYACNPGSITLKATYTEGAKTYTTEQTFPYFTSINDYQARGDHKAGAAEIEVIDGNKFKVTRCTVCGTELSKVAVEPDKTDLSASDVTVVLGQTVKALVGTNSTGELTYKVENEEIATVDSEGVIRGVNYGTTTVTVSLAAKDNWEAKEATFIVSVRPQPTVIWQLRDEGDGTMVVRWRTIEGVDGVQFAYATSEDFSDAKYSAWTISNTQRRYGLEAATYYVKARTYVLGEDGKRIYSTWCTPKSISLGRYLPAPASMFCEVKANGSVAFKVAPSAKAEGYQISYDNGVEEKTSSAATAEFTRKLGTGSFTVKVRAYAYAEDGKYYSAWTPVGTVTIQ